MPHKELVELSSDSISDFDSIDNSLETFGISAENRVRIYSVLAAILNLGNLTFVSNSSDDGCYIPTESQEMLKNVAILLGVNETELEDVLTNRMILVKDSKIR